MSSLHAPPGECGVWERDYDLASFLGDTASMQSGNEASSLTCNPQLPELNNSAKCASHYDALSPNEKSLQMPGSEMVDALPTENSHHPAVSLIQTGNQERHCTNRTVVADDCDIRTAKPPRQSSRRNLITLLVVFVVSLLFMTILFSNFPELDE